MPQTELRLVWPIWNLMALLERAPQKQIIIHKKKKAQIKFKELKKNEKELKKKDSFCTFAITRAPLFKKLNS